MISGMIMVFVAIWIYQSAIKAKLDNVIVWVAVSAAAFFVLVFLFQYININILESFRSSEGGAAYEAINGADRKNEGDFTGFGGILKSLYEELSPSIFSFLIVAFLRLNLFSGLKEVFVNIKDSFKSPQ